MKYVKYGFCSIFIALLFLMFFTTLNNNNTVSNLEKRNLQTFPKFSTESVMNGSYMTELTDAFSDQLEFRDYLVKGYYALQLQKYSGDVVIGKNNDLYSSYQKVKNKTAYKQKLKKSVNLINKVGANVDAKFIFLSVPRKDAVETQNLPDSYINSAEIYEESVSIVKENLNKKITFIDAYEIFKNDNHSRRYYYLTDHHITPRGAELLYKEVLTQINDERIKEFDLSNYEIGETIIKGSFNDQIGQSIKTSPEELYLLPKFGLEYTRYENEEKSDLKVYKEGNEYTDVFMEGDCAYTVVDTNRPHLPNILYVGSSFTNILEAMSVPSFNKMVSIDYRHNTSGNSIKHYVEKHNIDYVVYIPAQSNNSFAPAKIKEHLGK